MNPTDECIYHKFSGSKYIFLVLYVGNVLLATNDLNLLRDTKQFLSNTFEMKDLGNASYVLCIQIYRDRSKDILGLLTSRFRASLKHKDDGQTRFLKPNSQRQDIIIKYWVSIGSIHREQG